MLTPQSPFDLNPETPAQLAALADVAREIRIAGEREELANLDKLVAMLNAEGTREMLDRWTETRDRQARLVSALETPRMPGPAVDYVFLNGHACPRYTSSTEARERCLDKSARTNHAAHR